MKGDDTFEAARLLLANGDDTLEQLRCLACFAPACSAFNNSGVSRAPKQTNVSFLQMNAGWQSARFRDSRW
jgi:hypothetical protein